MTDLNNKPDDLSLPDRQLLEKLAKGALHKTKKKLVENELKEKMKNLLGNQ